MKVLEKDLSVAVEGYLAIRENQRDLFWSRTDPASKDVTERGRRVRKGWADITVCVKGGRFVGIELKRPGKSKTTKEQLQFRAAIHALGGIAVECKSVKDVQRVVDGALALRFLG